jgi:hypothetical protein
MSTLPAEHESLDAFLIEALSDHERGHVLLATFSQWNFSLIAMSEIGLSLRELGGEVSIAMWGPHTPLPDVGWSTPRWIARAFGSRSRDEQVQQALISAGMSRSCFVQPPIKGWQPAEPSPVPKVRSRSNIRALTYRGSPMGRAILQLRPDHAVPVTDAYVWPKPWLERSMESYAYVYDQARELISRKNITAVVVSNGRFLHDRASAEAAIDAGIAVLYYDFGGAQTAFDLTRETTHDWEALQRRMVTLYRNWPENERDDIGGQWFLNRSSHKDSANASFTDAQVLGETIEIPDGKRLVVFFSSSGDEFAELELDWSDYFHGQPEALAALSEVCKHESDVYLVVRSHPHKRRKAPQDVADWHDAVGRAQPDLHVDEFSEIDSYALMRQADVVVTYGSTTGVEAGYMGRAVVVMGPSAYDNLGCATRPRDIDELRTLIQNPSPSDRTGATAFGLMMQRRGFNVSRLSNKVDASFSIAGRVIEEPSSIVRKISDRLSRHQRSRISEGLW